jgi:phosphoglycolate phosphatase-like HAD superfamily hydrolase
MITNMIYVFDFDGVLANTKELYVKFLSKAPFMNEEKARATIEKNTLKYEPSSMISHILEKFFLGELEKHLGEDPTHLLFIERVQELYKLEGRKFVMSKNQPHFMKKILGNHAELFVDLYGMDFAKTKGIGIEKILESEHLTPVDCIFITDTVSDILEVENVVLNENLFAVDWGYCSEKDLRKYVRSENFLSDFTGLKR